MGHGKSAYSYNKDGRDTMYSLIMVIVPKGKAESVMEAAIEGGARGGTVIKARGVGQSDADKVFNMEIEPEREMIVFVSDDAYTEKITKAIGDRIDTSAAGNGLIFCQDVNKVYGIRKD
jgi:nitrogen regulatory protein PII